MRDLLTYPEVAAALKVTREWFYRNHRRLVRQHGFPAPMPGMGNRWDPRAIELWQDGDLARQKLLPAAPAPPAAPPEEDGDAWAGILDRRAEALAGGP